MKPINIIAIIFLLILSSCSSNDIDDATKRNENWCWFVNKETGKGEWVPVSNETTLPDGDYTLFYCNGVIREKGKLKNKKECDTVFCYDIKGKIVTKGIIEGDTISRVIMPDGKYKLYYPSCELLSEGERKNDKTVGTYMEYYKNGVVKISSKVSGDTVSTIEKYESGFPQDSFVAIKNQRNGVYKRWFANRVVDFMCSYQSGKRHGLLMHHYESGQIKDSAWYINDSINGIAKSWYSNEQQKEITEWKNGLQQGSCIKYYENGKIKYKDFKIMDKCVGEVVRYYENGKLKYKDYNIMGKVDGEVVSYYENGQKEFSMFYKMDTKIGEYNSWYENGNPKFNGRYKNGEKDGVWKEYDEDGNLTTNIYKEGSLIEN